MVVRLEQNNRKLSLRRGNRDGRFSEAHISDKIKYQEIRFQKVQGPIDEVGSSANQQNWNYGYSISAAARSESAPSSSFMHIRLNKPTSIGIDPFPYTHRQVQEQENMQSIKDVIIAGILIALIVILMINFIFLVYEPVIRFFRRYFGRFVSENQTLVDRRYKTIDKWLIQKTVQPHDNICRKIQNYTRLNNGAASLGISTNVVAIDGPSSTFHNNNRDFHHPLRLASSFDTKTTHDFSSSSSCSETTSFNDGELIDRLNGNCKIESLDDMDASFKKLKEENVDAIITTLPDDDFEIECDQYQQQSSKISKLPHGPSLLLTREQVLDRMEITKRKNESISDDNRKSRTSDNSYARSCNEQDHRQECSICMEVFEVGDKISFSPSEGCHHVFHHDCLRRWLLRKTDCPCCRITMLPIDRPDPKEDCGEEVRGGQTEVTQTISSVHQFRNHQVRRQIFRTRSAQTKKPWYHRNPRVLHERLNKKCGTYCCVTCGVVVLKTSLREDLCTKVIPEVQGTDNTTAEL